MTTSIIIDKDGLWEVKSDSPKKLNLGCGKYPLPGYFNVDEHEPADLQTDVWDVVFSNLEEVRMDHFLEHIPWTQTHALLTRVHGWLREGGLLRVEVPDMAAIFERGTGGDWLRYVYGSQQHEGEFHRAGFTAVSLYTALDEAGFTDVDVKSIISTFRTRQGMPCLVATAHA